ncbi:uncharacterized protein LOC116930068 [Daphnia magna]|uniref:Uncharacterized protein n=1 Tax=Daphnia magna TaxID=35525 RepID=A0A0P4YMR5_9CRUS|nr:uncharacterized protein LOC116930068 [Daphnia magna]
MSFNGNWIPSNAHFLSPVAQVHRQYLHHQQEQGTLHIPRPVLTVVQMPEEQNSLDSINLPPTPPSSSPSNELTMSVSGSYIYDRCGTPTRFTLLGESGAITRKNRTTPTTCQLSLTFCTLALLALVGMIVYMEVYMNERRV